VIIEFEREGEDEFWLPLGLARTQGRRLDLEEAMIALGISRDGPVSEGLYRFRVIEQVPRWRYVEVDRVGVVRPVDRARISQLT
jgi:hypothetical protein